ncbi:MAG: tetratricopeptide repeat protein [Candidatus Dadabacteria bacterium]|nr:MAG: tetratricopeptide repeat protein [Candidatus Dadabacteria bacterium]
MRITRFQAGTLIVLAIIFLTFWPALNNGFVWNDSALAGSPVFYDFNLLWQVLSGQIRDPQFNLSPLSALLFYFENSFFGGRPFGFHLVSLTVHLLNTVLLIYLLFKIWPTEDNARLVTAQHLIALIYALHPALLEPVAYISAQPELFSAFFMLLSLVLLESGLKFNKFLAALFYLFSLLFSLYAVIFIFILPFWLKYRKKPVSLRTYLYFLFPLALSFVLYYLAVFRPPSVNASSVDIYSAATLISRTVLEYLSVLVFPFYALRPVHYLAPISDPLSIPALISYAVVIGLLTLFIRLKKVFPDGFWLAATVLFSFLPLLNIIPVTFPGGSIASERYLAFPLALAIIFITHVIFKLTDGHRLKKRVYLFYCFLLIWAVFSIRTVQSTLPKWKNDFALFEWASQKAPESYLPDLKLAENYLKIRQYQKAMRSAAEAQTLAPKNPATWRIKAEIYLARGDTQSAVLLLKEALKLSKDNSLTLTALGKALIQAKKYKEAIGYLNKALKLNPLSADIHILLAEGYFNLKQKKEAKAHLEAANRYATRTELRRLQNIKQRLGTK